MNWKLIVTILCIYGFFKEFRPLEPFLTPYLRSDLKNFTDVQLYSQVYPVWTYSYLAALVPTFLLTDLLRYNVVLIFGALLYGSTWILLIFGSTIAHMQLMQFFYGLATATEIAYYAYAYAAIDSEHYKKTTSYVRCVVECGRFCSYAFGQTLISTRTVAYLDLNYIAMAGSIIIFLVALFLPCISWRRSFDRIRDVGEETPKIMGEENVPLNKIVEQPVSSDRAIDQTTSADQQQQQEATTKEVKTYPDFVLFYIGNLWQTFKRIYSTTFMWKWSLWCALATCGMLQVTNYIQTLWDLAQTSEGDVWNGIVEAINTFFGKCDGGITGPYLHA